MPIPIRKQIVYNGDLEEKDDNMFDRQPYTERMLKIFA